MSRRRRIQDQVKGHFSQIIHFELLDESHMHSVPEGAESHFKLLLVSNDFSSLSRVQRQQKLYALLSDELQSGLHALTMRLLTAEEWEKQKSEFVSPDCHGGSKV